MYNSRKKYKIKNGSYKKSINKDITYNSNYNTNTIIP